MLRTRRERLRHEHRSLRERLILIETELDVADAEDASHKKGHGPVEPMPRTTSAASRTARSGGQCPFLASYANRAVQLDKPSAEHVCYAIGHAHWAYGPADVEAQRSVCMRRAVYPRCPRYRHAVSLEPHAQQAPEDNKKGWGHLWRDNS